MTRSILPPTSRKINLNFAFDKTLNLGGELGWESAEIEEMCKPMMSVQGDGRVEGTKM